MSNLLKFTINILSAFFLPIFLISGIWAYIAQIEYRLTLQAMFNEPTPICCLIIWGIVVFVWETTERGWWD